MGRNVAVLIGPTTATCGVENLRVDFFVRLDLFGRLCFGLFVLDVCDDGWTEVAIDDLIFFDVLTGFLDDGTKTIPDPQALRVDSKALDDLGFVHKDRRVGDVASVDFDGRALDFEFDEIFVLKSLFFHDLFSFTFRVNDTSPTQH